MTKSSAKSHQKFEKESYQMFCRKFRQKYYQNRDEIFIKISSKFENESHQKFRQKLHKNCDEIFIKISLKVVKINCNISMKNQTVARDENSLSMKKNQKSQRGQFRPRG